MWKVGICFKSTFLMGNAALNVNISMFVHEIEPKHWKTENYVS